MKNFRFIAIAIALASLFVLPSCVQAEFDVMPEYVTGINVTAEFPDFSKFDGIITKVDYSVSGSNINFSWSEEGDTLGIYPVGGEQVAFPLSSTTGGSSAMFDGGAWALRTSYDYAAYYPFSSVYYDYDESGLPVSYLGQKQTGNDGMSHLGAYSYMAAMATTPDSNGSVNLKMKQLGAWILIRAYVPEGMSVGNVTLTDMTSDLIVGGGMDLTQSASSADAFAPTLLDPVYSPSISLAVEDLTAGTDQLKFWMMLPPQDLTGHDLKLDITSPGGGTSVSSVMKGKNISRAKAVVLNFGTFEATEVDYLCFTAETAGVSVQLKLESESDAWASSSTVFDLEYSMDGENWDTFVLNRNYTLTNVGDKIYFRGDNDSFSVSPDQYIHFVTTGPVVVSGNIMTLLDKSGLSETIPGEYTFANMFKNAAITSAPSLPATTLAGSCYYGMFSGCTLLEKAPDLPATTLAGSCYYGMFSGCTLLEKAPDLPATTLAGSCYRGMFAGCTSLKEAPTLPATTLAASCYWAMFSDCTRLTTAPVLPATTLANGCYYQMFLRCSSLSRIEVAFSEWEGPTSPTGLWCYYVPQGGTFVCPSDLEIKFGESFIPEGWSVQNSEESATAPDYLCFTAELPNSTVGMEVAGDNWTLPVLQYSTDMKNWKAFDISSMTITLAGIGDKVYFRGDNSAFSKDVSNYVIFVMTGKIAASGNIMTLVDKTGHRRTIPNTYAFAHLFEQCSSLSKAPELPATNLADFCYYSMFKGCSSLTVAPELPATTLVSGCYVNLFEDCTSLSKVKVSFTEWDNSATLLWLHNVAPAGEFICPGELPAIINDSYNIPSGWAPDYLCFTAEEAGASVMMKASMTGWTLPTLEYSTDMANWSPLVIGTTKVMLANAGDKVYFRGNNSTFSLSAEKYVYFELSGIVSAGGNVMSLMDKSCQRKTFTSDYAFNGLFSGCSQLVHAPDLPATTLSNYCYNRMFEDCVNLPQAPELPATTLKNGCYSYMFYGCNGLTQAPELPAKVMKEGCYMGMFWDCTSLTPAPELPATTLADNCYQYMFQGCTSLISAPALPATTLADGCYLGMFQGCTNLGRIEVGFTSWSYATALWCIGVASHGTFVCPSRLAIICGIYNIPEGWAVQNSDPASETWDYLCFTASEPVTIGMYVNGENWAVPSLAYSFDRVRWQPFVPGTTEVTTRRGNNKVYFRGDNSTFSVGSDKFVRFTITSTSTGASVAASGNIMSLVDGTCTSTTIPNSYAFSSLFAGCYLLTSAPSLPATTLTEGCYYNMFNDCPALLNAPALPATTLAEGCYQYMFLNCTSLVSGPRIYARNLAPYSCAGMFLQCFKLNSLEVYFTTWDASATASWMSGVPDTGTFKCPDALPEIRGNSYIKSGWTVIRKGLLPGMFSVSSTKQVQFSKGNLQATYDGSKYCLGFAANQYDYIGDAAGNTTIDSQTSGAVVDLFGWSTSANNYGINTSASSIDYSGDFVDWGKNIDDGSTWRTLSRDEWVYLFKTRTNASSLYKTGVTVCGVTNCLIIAPDGYTETIADSYGASTWPAAEAAGLICLPPTGRRVNSGVSYASEYGYYWSSSGTGISGAYHLSFDNSDLDPFSYSIGIYRYYAQGVRLVTDVTE